MNAEEIKAALVRMNGAFDVENINDQAALVMLSALEVGTKIRPLARFTGLPQKRVGTFVNRLRANRIFRGEKIFANWFHETDGGIAFNLDVLVATGMLSKA